MREDHGFTVPGQILFVADALEDQGNNEGQVNGIEEKD
jgi:HD superfamily phosphohydrolase YqeK